VRAIDQHLPVRDAALVLGPVGRPASNGEGALQMQFARAAIVVEAEGGLAGLLHLDQRQPRPDRMDGACGQVEQIARARRVPGQQVFDGAVLCCRLDLGRGHLAHEADGKRRARLGIEHQPALLLARLSCKRGGVGGMHLDG